MLYALTHDELERLYGAPGLEQYLPEAVLARTVEGDAVPALCYNLAAGEESEEPDRDYAVRLRAALEKLGFPSEYTASI